MLLICLIEPILGSLIDSLTIILLSSKFLEQLLFITLLSMPLQLFQEVTLTLRLLNIAKVTLS